MNTNIYYDVVGFQCLDHIEHQTNDLYLTRCGIQHCPSTHSWGPKMRPQYHMHFILDGAGYFEIDNLLYHLKRGQIFLIPPNTVSHYYAEPSNPWTYAFISFEGNKAEQYVRQAGFHNSYVRDTILSPEQFSSLIEEMLKTHQLTITNELKRVSLLFSLFSLLTESSKTSHGVHQDHDYSSETYFEHALQYIQMNYMHPIHIQDIADYIGITRSYLFHIFTKKLHLSPQKYLLNYRVEKAKYLLASTNQLIKDIAFSVGYPDSLAFSRMFRNETGISPSEFRENLSQHFE